MEAMKEVIVQNTALAFDGSLVTLSPETHAELVAALNKYGWQGEHPPRTVGADGYERLRLWLRSHGDTDLLPLSPTPPDSASPTLSPAPTLDAFDEQPATSSHTRRRDN